MHVLAERGGVASMSSSVQRSMDRRYSGHASLCVSTCAADLLSAMPCVQGRCYGCGCLLQCTDGMGLGFVKADKYEAKKKHKQLDKVGKGSDRDSDDGYHARTQHEQHADRLTPMCATHGEL